MKPVIIVIIAVVFGIAIGLSVNVSAQENLIPAWIKSTAGFWVDGQIGDSEFISALQYLVKEGILVIPQEKVEDTNDYGYEVTEIKVDKMIRYDFPIVHVFFFNDKNDVYLKTSGTLKFVLFGVNHDDNNRVYDLFEPSELSFDENDFYIFRNAFGVYDVMPYLKLDLSELKMLEENRDYFESGYNHAKTCLVIFYLTDSNDEIWYDGCEEKELYYSDVLFGS